MLEELMNRVRQYARSTVVENPEVPNEHNEDVMRQAGSSIFSELQGLANNNDADGLSGLLRGEESHPAMAGVKNNFADNIVQKFGINAGSAKNIAGSLIPLVLGSLLQRPGAAYDNNTLSLRSIISSVTGGNNVRGNGLLSNLGVKLGLDRDRDGDVDLADITRMAR